MSKRIVLHSCHLQLGDVVRAIRGPLVRTPEAPALVYTLKDGTKRAVQATAGWREPIINGPEDFRQGYDVMTVYKASDSYISLLRPYVHFNVDGTVSCIGFEEVEMIPRQSGAHWYELLGGGR